MPDGEMIIRYILFGLGGFLGTTGFIFIFARMFGERYGYEWHEDDSAPRHRWGIALLLASAVCLTLFILRL